MFASNYTKPEKCENLLGSPYLASMTYIQAMEQPDWSFFMHTHDDSLELSYVLGGRGALYCGQKYYELKPGTIVVKNPKVQHAENSDPKSPIEQVCFLISGLKLENASENVIPAGFLSPVITANCHRFLLDSATKDMLDMALKNSHPDLSYLNQLLVTVLYAILDEYKSISSASDTDSDGEQMEKVRIWLDAHYMEDLSLTSVADHFHFSQFYLSRQFKKHTGFTFNQYLISCRIGEAQRRLIFKNERTDETALKCGFSNLSYFYTTFRKKVGCTPTEYKRIYSKSI